IRLARDRGTVRLPVVRADPAFVLGLRRTRPRGGRGNGLHDQDRLRRGVEENPPLLLYRHDDRGGGPPAASHRPDVLVHRLLALARGIRWRRRGRGRRNYPVRSPRFALEGWPSASSTGALRSSLPAIADWHIRCCLSHPERDPP